VSTVTPRTSSARNEVRQVAPKLIEPSEKVLITHLAFYSGWPTAMTAGRIALQVLGEKKS
jgi:hypothetical protein